MIRLPCDYADYGASMLRRLLGEDCQDSVKHGDSLLGTQEAVAADIATVVRIFSWIEQDGRIHDIVVDADIEIGALHLRLRILFNTLASPGINAIIIVNSDDSIPVYLQIKGSVIAKDAPIPLHPVIRENLVVSDDGIVVLRRNVNSTTVHQAVLVRMCCPCR